MWKNPIMYFFPGRVCNGEDGVSVPGSESDWVAEPKSPNVIPKWARG